MPHYKPLTLGPCLLRVIETYLLSRPGIRKHLSDVITKKLPLRIPASALEEFRQVNAKATGTELRPPRNPLSTIRHDLLSGLARCFHDPGDVITHWLVEGAPAGMVRDFRLDRTFEKVDGSRPREPGDLHTDFDQAANYSGFDHDEDAKDTIRMYRDKGYLQEFLDVGQAEEQLGSRPVLSQFCVITRVKDNKTNEKVILVKTSLMPKHQARRRSLDLHIESDSARLTS
eukprot:6467134-Amphidinium_carterae.1